MDCGADVSKTILTKQKKGIVINIQEAYKKCPNCGSTNLNYIPG